MLDPAQLLRIPHIDAGFDISPDGTHLAFAWNKTGEWQIYELESGEGEIPQITQTPGGKLNPR